MLNKIIDYYTEENLTKITLKIIDAYRNKKYSYLIGLGKIIDETIVEKNRNIQKLFSHLIMLFHPDRLNLYKIDISDLIQKNRSNELQKYETIIAVLDNLERIPDHSLNNNHEIDIEYEYGYDEEDFDSVIDESDFDDTDASEEKNLYEFDFISLLRYRELGNIDDELPSFYFEELEGELILPDSNLFDLSGLEKCTNLEALDLSNNQIIDITPIGFLNQLTEINLSGNKIQDIDVLDNLHSHLFNLLNLKYVNIIGNNIPKKQLEKLKQNNRILVY